MTLNDIETNLRWLSCGDVPNFEEDSECREAVEEAYFIIKKLNEFVNEVSLRDRVSEECCKHCAHSDVCVFANLSQMKDKVCELYLASELLEFFA